MSFIEHKASVSGWPRSREEVGGPLASVSEWSLSLGGSRVAARCRFINLLPSELISLTFFSTNTSQSRWYTPEMSLHGRQDCRRRCFTIEELRVAYLLFTFSLLGHRFGEIFLDRDDFLAYRAHPKHPRTLRRVRRTRVHWHGLLALPVQRRRHPALWHFSSFSLTSSGSSSIVSAFLVVQLLAGSAAVVVSMSMRRWVLVVQTASPSSGCTLPKFRYFV